MARHPQSLPEPKSEETITYVSPDGTELEVVSDASKAALAVLRNQGFRPLQEVFDEEDEAALEKAEKAEAAVAKKTPAKKAPSKAPSKE